jgi:hypothetical protein
MLSEDVTKLKYFGQTPTHRDCIREETKGQLNSGNACYRLVLNPFSVNYSRNTGQVPLLRTRYSKCHVTSNKVTSELECAEDYISDKGVGSR